MSSSVGFMDATPVTGSTVRKTTAEREAAGKGGWRASVTRASRLSYGETENEGVFYLCLTILMGSRFLQDLPRGEAVKAGREADEGSITTIEWREGRRCFLATVAGCCFLCLLF